MRFVFLIPDLDTSLFWKASYALISRSQLRQAQTWAKLRLMRTDVVFGGALNLMRHCLVARNCGADAVLATIRGTNTYKNRGVPELPMIRWSDRQPDDVCIVPDYVTELIEEVEGAVIAYLQVPIHTPNNFDYLDRRIALWTDSPYMEAVCQQIYPGKTIQIVPNIVDDRAFPFIPQAQREAGLLLAFPRKGADYIAQTQACYQELGRDFWRFELIDGLPFNQLAQQFRRPQVFLASAQVEGCALPPQESMAAGIVVVGRTAQGANFCMQHGETAMNAETPEAAAKCLLELEDEELRSRISLCAHQHISRYFPSGEPTAFWQQVIQSYTASRIHQKGAIEYCPNK